MGENRGHSLGFRPHVGRVLIEITRTSGQRKRRAGNEECVLHWAEIPLAEFTARSP
jgi:hypothetical protein